VARLRPHGLALFGNPGWRKLLTHNAAVLASLQSGPALTKHADLRRVYNSSKISINLPQAHVAQDAVQYRVTDVMASNALMITKHNPTSDLYRVFGEDCPIPTYSDLEELERLCVHYLANEAARREIVAQCNSLVATGFSFAERAADLLRIVGLGASAKASPGAVRRIDLRMLSA
jgi:spore maturation protein CgeB